VVGRIGRLPRCQARGCRGRVGRAVEIELPGSWLGAGLAEFAALPVVVGLCRRCGRELERRLRLAQEARAQYDRALAVIDGGLVVQRRLAELQEHLLEAEGAVAWQQARATRAEFELGVLQRAHLRLLRATGSEVADERELRLGLGLGLPAAAGGAPIGRT
jgi:hypothetical protein